MKITTDYNVKIFRNNNSSRTKNNAVENPISTQKIPEYNPVYYKPVNFTGENISPGFETYFPKDILKISEQEFNEIMLKSIGNPAKRNKLAEYITSLTAKDNQTMNFINMWKRQIPTLVSQGLLTTMPSNTSDFFRRISILGSKNSANSSLQKFLNSDFQTDIIMKDGKSVTAGIISWKLFNLANADPEPHTKAALYLAALAVGAIGYSERSKDIQKIQNEQFLQAIKEMMKIGVLDPYLLLHYVDKSRVNLSENDQKDYENWKIDRVKDINYQKTGVTVDRHNDFDIPEAKNVLLILIQTLQNIGFDDEKIGAFLQYFAATYDSVGETREAEYLIRMAVKTYRHIRSPRTIEAKETLAYLCEKNQKYSEALNELHDITCFSNKRNDPDYTHRINAELNFLALEAKQIAKCRKLDYILRTDSKISKSKERKDAFSKLFNEYKYNYYTSEESNLQEDALSFLLTIAHAGKINDDNLKKLLISLSSYPLESLDYKPADKSTDNNKYHIIYNLGVDEAEEEKFEENDELLNSIISDSNKYIAERAKELESKIFLPEFNETTNSYEKASIIVGTNLLNGTLNNYVQQILQKEDKDCTQVDADVLKICADNLYQASKDDYITYFHAIHSQQPKYFNLLQKRIDIMAELYGDYSENLYEAIAEYGEKEHSPETLIYNIIPVLKDAPKSIQEKYLPEMYARYGKMKYFEIQTHKKWEFNDKQALDVIVAYKKYLDTAKKVDETKLMEFLNFLDDIYTNEPTETCSAGLGYVHDVPVFNVPLFDSINSYGTSKQEFNKYYHLTTWGLATLDNNLESIVQKAPGIYRVNERKFLDMKKKHETAIFQKRFNEKMDNKMIAIEKSVDNLIL